MSSKEQKTPEGQAPEEIIMDQHEEIEAVEPEASAEQVDPRDEKIANLEAQLAEAQTRERDGILRVKAEMENLRRRTELDIEKAHKFGVEKFAKNMLPVLDSLEKALELAGEERNPMIEGIEATYRQMVQAMQQSGMTEINPVGEKFDPAVHQAIAMVPAQADQVSGQVAQVFQRGWLINGRVLRAAMVSVIQ